jgi:hypothetical protein
LRHLRQCVQVGQGEDLLPECSPDSHCGG